MLTWLKRGWISHKTENKKAPRDSFSRLNITPPRKILLQNLIVKRLSFVKVSFACSMNTQCTIYVAEKTLQHPSPQTEKIPANAPLFLSRPSNP